MVVRARGTDRYGKRKRKKTEKLLETTRLNEKGAAFVLSSGKDITGLT